MFLGITAPFPKKNMYVVFYKLVARYLDIQQLQKRCKISEGVEWRWWYARTDFVDTLPTKGRGTRGVDGDMVFLLSVHSCRRRPSRCRYHLLLSSPHCQPHRRPPMSSPRHHPLPQILVCHFPWVNVARYIFEFIPFLILSFRSF